jgi:hypothetical protein
MSNQHGLSERQQHVEAQPTAPLIKKPDCYSTIKKTRQGDFPMSHPIGHNYTLKMQVKSEVCRSNESNSNVYI